MNSSRWVFAWCCFVHWFIHGLRFYPISRLVGCLERVWVSEIHVSIWITFEGKGRKKLSSTVCVLSGLGETSSSKTLNESDDDGWSSLSENRGWKIYLPFKCSPTMSIDSWHEIHGHAAAKGVCRRSISMNKKCVCTESEHILRIFVPKMSPVRRGMGSRLNQDN